MSSPTDLGRLNTADYEHVAELAGRLDKMWKEQGKPIDLNLLLPPAGSPARLHVLSELIKTDLEIRWRRNQGVRLDWYVERFEELGTVSELSPRMIYEEYRARQLHGDKPSLTSYQRRFPRQFAEVERLADADPLPTLAPAMSTPSAHPPTPSSPMTSNVISVSGGYRLIKRLGTGAFGEVWLAEAPGGVPVAVKKIYKPVDKDADEHEVKALDHIKTLNHPFLLATHSYWITPEGYLHIAMELAHSNLRDRLKECRDQNLRGLPQDELLQLMKQAAQALDFVHGKGLYHRDIKPDNIMVMNGFAKVGDFGLVRNQGTLGVESAGAGTLAYMAPECFLGIVGKYSDQYSLAISYVELRTKFRPFPPRDNQMAFMMDHKEGTPDLSLLDPVEQPIVLRALAKKPEDRFPTCLAFVQALEKALQPEPLAPRSQRPESWLREGSSVGPGGYLLQRRRPHTSAGGQFWESIAPGGSPVVLQVVENLDLHGVDEYLLAYGRARTFKDVPNVLQIHTDWLADSATGAVVSRAEVKRAGEAQRVALVGVLEWFDAEDLAQRCGGSNRILSQNQAADLLGYLRQAAGVIDLMNERRHTYAGRTVGVRHCAIRPDNLLLAGGDVKIADFRLAQTTTEAEATYQHDSIDLAPGYAAPELLDKNRGRVHERSDQYSLAMAYVKLRTGRLPFDKSQSRNRMIEEQLVGNLEFRDLPPGERDVIAKATSRRPEDRYSSCLALIDELDKVCKREVVVMPEPPSLSDDTLVKQPPTRQPKYGGPTPAHGTPGVPKWMQQGGADTDKTLNPRQEKTESRFDPHVPPFKQEQTQEQAEETSQRPSSWRVWAITVTILAFVMLAIGGVILKLNRSHPGPGPGEPLPDDPDRMALQEAERCQRDQRAIEDYYLWLVHANDPAATKPPGPSQPPPGPPPGEKLADFVKAQFPALNSKRSFEEVLSQIQKADIVEQNGLNGVALACWIECLFEKGAKAQAKLKIQNADILANAGSYGEYVTAVILADEEATLGKAYELLLKAIQIGEDGKLKETWLKSSHRKARASKFLQGAALAFAGKDKQKAYQAQMRSAALEPETARYDLLAQLAFEAGQYPATQDAALKYRSKVRIDSSKGEIGVPIGHREYQVAVWRAQATAAMNNQYAAAAQLFRELADWHKDGRLTDVQASELLKQVVDPGIVTAQQYFGEKKNDPERIQLAAEMYAARGRLFFNNQFDPQEFPDAKEQARKAFQKASDCYPPDAKDRILAKCRTWEGYLSPWTVDELELRRFAEKANLASADFSGARFLFGLWKHQQAVKKLPDADAVNSLEKEAIGELTIAITKAETTEKEDTPDFLDLYYAARSAARLIQADLLYQQYRKAKLKDYEALLKLALKDAEDAQKHKARSSWYPHLQLAHVLEDLAWRCEPDAAARVKKYEEVDAEFGLAISKSQNLEMRPIVGRARAFYRRVKYGEDSRTHLETAEKILDDATQQFTQSRDKAQLGEAHVWRALVCLELRDKANREKAFQSIAEAVNLCDESMAGVVLADVLHAVIETAKRLRASGQADPANLLLAQFRDKADDLGKNFPRRYGAAVLAKVACFECEEEFAKAIKCCDAALSNKRGLLAQDKVSLLQRKADLAMNQRIGVDYDKLTLDSDEASTEVARMGPSSKAQAKFLQASARTLRGFMKANKEDLSAALDLVEESIATDPDHPEGAKRRLAAADLAQSLNQRDKAVRYAKEIPKDPNATTEQIKRARAIITGGGQ